MKDLTESDLIMLMINTDYAISNDENAKKMNGDLLERLNKELYSRPKHKIMEVVVMHCMGDRELMNTLFDRIIKMPRKSDN